MKELRLETRKENGRLVVVGCRYAWKRFSRVKTSVLENSASGTKTSLYQRLMSAVARFREIAI